MNKKEILKLTNDTLNDKVLDLLGLGSGEISTTCGFYPEDIGYAMTDLFESVYGRGTIKDGAWVLSTVENGRDCAHACLIWKSKSFTKFRPLQVSVTCPRGEMARAITLCWVCAMLGVSDE